MKKFLITLLVAAVASTFTLALPTASFAAEQRKEVENRVELNNVTAKDLAATGAVPMGTAKKIIELRDQLGSFQNYDDLKELNLPKEQMDKLQQNTTIQGIASDCTC